jgi:hypothetical protein
MYKTIGVRGSFTEERRKVVRIDAHATWLKGFFFYWIWVVAYQISI